MSRVNTRLKQARDRPQLRTTIAGVLQDAAAGRTRDLDGRAYTPAGLRSLERALAQVEAAAVDPAALRGMSGAALDGLGMEIVERQGLPPGRVDPIVHALRVLAAAGGERPPRGPLAADAGTPAPAPAATPAPTATATATPTQAATSAPTPTYAMLALGARVGAWTEYVIVIAFVLTAIGLALELA